MARRLALALGLIALCGLQPACKRKVPEPSAQYAKGAKLHQDLYVRQLDDAYLDPRMDEAVAALKLVPPESSDSESAVELLATITKGRDEAKKQKAEREKKRAEMQQGLTAISAIDPSAVLGRSAKEAGQPGAPEASTALDPFGPGASIAELNKQAGGCLVPGMPFTEQGSGATGTTYKLGSSQACKDKLPGLVGEVLLVANGRIYRRVPETDLRPTDVKLPEAAPDAGVPPAAAPPAAPKAAAPAPAPAPAPPPAARPANTQTSDISTPQTPAGDITTGQIDPGSKAP